MPRILHTSDLHINALRRYRNRYLLRMEDTLFQITSLAKEHAVDYIVVAGDFFEYRNVLHEERNLLSKWLTLTGTPIIGITGNHDKRSEDVGDTVLAYLSGLPVVGKEGERHLIYDRDPTLLFWPNVIFMLIPYEKWTDSEFYLIVDALLSQIPAQDERPVVVVAHEAISGCQADDGRLVEHARQIHLDKKMRKKFKRVTYWALGDMHSHQSMGRNAWYSGAPHQTKFGENPEKGVLIVDTDHPSKPEFVRLESGLLRLVEEDSSEVEFTDRDLYKLRLPRGSKAPLNLPDNVEVEGILPAQEGVPESMVDLLDGLDVALLRAGLKKDLVPTATSLARRAVKKVGLKISISD